MGQKKLLSVSSFGRLKSPDLKTYSSFFALSFNVPFVFMKVFQAHVQSADFFSNVLCSILLCCRALRNAFDWAPIWDVGLELALCDSWSNAG